MDSDRREGRPPSTLSAPDRARAPAGAPALFPTSVRVGLYATGLLSMALLFLPLWGVRPPPPEPEPAPLVPGVSALLDGRLPMTVNDQVERWIHRFLGADRGSFEAYLVREGLYGGMIRERLRARGMPEELLYLAMIESGFSAAATSKVSASGVWQFMDATAQAYGLTVDYWVDERRDPVRATDAALDYLEELYGMFGSWRLAAAAYNAGPGRVANALRHVDGRVDEEVYWEISELLPLETREYVPKILAATLLAQQAEHFGIEVEKSLPYLFEQVLVPGGTPLREIALALGVDPSLIRELNPHLVRAVTPPGASHLVRVPLGDSHRLVASLDRPGE